MKFDNTVLQKQIALNNALSWLMCKRREHIWNPLRLIAAYLAITIQSFEIEYMAFLFLEETSNITRTDVVPSYK